MGVYIEFEYGMPLGVTVSTASFRPGVTVDAESLEEAIIAARAELLARGWLVSGNAYVVGYYSTKAAYERIFGQQRAHYTFADYTPTPEDVDRWNFGCTIASRMARFGAHWMTERMGRCNALYRWGFAPVP